MLSQPFHRLLAVSASFRIADQLVVAGVPLIAAAVFKLPEDQIGAMIAAQGSAWLLMSLPAGVMVDRIAPLNGLRRGMVLSVVGIAVLLCGFLIGSPVLFTFGAFLSACAAVLGFLAESASVQRLMAGSALGKANARIQLLQSSAILIGPLVMGWLIARGFVLTGFLVAGALACLGLAIALGFAQQEPPAARQRAPLAEIREGLDFVRRQPLLRGIVACALFWNMAFMALAAVYVPFALKQLALTPDSIGLAQSAMGVGSILAALTAGWAMTRLPPRFLLFFGPAGSMVAVGLLLLPHPLAGLTSSATAYLLLGFGPILWFVCQNTIRQLVTPKGLLGRVGAVIQLAIYGVRSIGALLGGQVAAAYEFDAALWLIAVLFGLSTLAVPLSALGRLSAMPESADRADLTRDASLPA
jgi:predicted MFS family arabinose efflux permease